MALSVDNRNRGWAPLTQLVATGGAFAVEVRPHILALDVDPSEHPDPAKSHLAMATLHAALTATGVTALIVPSGRPDHFHLFAAVGDDRDLRSVLDDWCRDHGLSPRSMIRPPGTPHRSGAPGCSIDAATVATMAQHLRSKPKSAVLPALLARLAVRPISSRMRKVLREGHTADRYRSASEARMAFAIHATATGHGPAWIARVLSDPENELGRRWRERPAKWRATELRRLVDKAETYLAESKWAEPITCRSDGERAVEAWAEELDAVEWRGQAGGTDRAVAEALARLALVRGGPVFVCGQQQAAVDAGVHERTARNSLRRLQAAGWLEQVEAPTPKTATRWRLRVPATAAAGLPGPADWLTVTRDDDLGGDVALWRKGLGKGATRVWRGLATDVTVRVAVLAERLSMSAASVRRYLRTLAKHGLAHRTRHRWARTGDCGAQIAVRLGVAGTREQRRVELEQMRALRRAYRKPEPRGPVVLAPVSASQTCDIDSCPESPLPYSAVACPTPADHPDRPGGNPHARPSPLQHSTTNPRGASYGPVRVPPARRHLPRRR
jgi:hypothetical protein